MTQKSYSNSELFTVANKIRKETGCSQKEAFAKAKMELKKTNNSFDVYKALKKDAKVMTKSGKRVKVICITRDKILCQVYSNVAFYLDSQVKYNLDGSRWSPKQPCDEDLIMM